jgi:hypothetical protein
MSFTEVLNALAHPLKPPSLHWVYVVLASHADINTGLCWPSLDTIRREAGVGRSTASLALPMLEQLGRITIQSYQGPNHVNRYVVHAPNETIQTVQPLDSQANCLMAGLSSHGTLPIQPLDTNHKEPQRREERSTPRSAV